jgi:hypothetical protein
MNISQEAKERKQRLRQAQAEPPPNGKGKGHAPHKSDNPKQSPKPEVYTAAALLQMDLPEPRWAVPGILPEGLVVLGGKPKLGKSWLALHLGIAVATGGYALGVRGITAGDALYLALEDNWRRLQDRFRKLNGSMPGPELARLTLARRWPRQDAGGQAYISEWLEEHPEARLVVIDTWGKFRTPRRSRGGSEIYDEDYGHASELQDLAEAYHVCILLISHCRKGAADDWQDSLLGSQGLAGAADATMVLQRERSEKEAKLHITGRDLEERSLHLTWRGDCCMWDVASPGAAPTAPPIPPAVQKAMNWLLTHLADGQEHLVFQVRRASEGVDIGSRQLYSARTILGVIEDGPKRRLTWKLPPTSATP